ncbi:MAG: hypothetical protein QOG62_482, partial [Thermoleophilaceae bacterium]|nr:hypothetical protein [Thermoleophilaceae bacterium]
QVVRALEDAGLSPAVEFREARRDWMQAVRVSDVICVQVDASDQQTAADLVWRLAGEDARVSADWA